MRKKYFLGRAIFGTLLLSTAPSFAVFPTLETLSQDSLPGLFQKHTKLRPYVKDLMVQLPNVLKEVESDSPTSFKRLNFKVLLATLFQEKVWLPSSYCSQDKALQTLFHPYLLKTSPEDMHMIFLANVLFETGTRLYQQNQDSMFLEYAAAIGHTHAQRELFSIKFKNQNFEEAKNYLFSAAAQGDGKALLRLSEVLGGNWGKRICPMDLDLEKILCQEAALLQDPEAIFRIEVATRIEGMFGEPRNFQQGVQKAKELAERGNEEAKRFINAISKMSKEALQEGNDSLTDADFDFLRSFLKWRDAWDEEEAEQARGEEAQQGMKEGIQSILS